MLSRPPISSSRLIGGITSVQASPRGHRGSAADNGIDYLLTWNCKHIANAKTRNLIEHCLRSRGYDPPVLCTPEELMEP
jgi:hypothetical protein